MPPIQKAHDLYGQVLEWDSFTLKLTLPSPVALYWDVRCTGRWTQGGLWGVSEALESYVPGFTIVETIAEAMKQFERSQEPRFGVWKNCVREAINTLREEPF
jgi:hypothetical protein